jgi:hypothetical protein
MPPGRQPDSRSHLTTQPPTGAVRRHLYQAPSRPHPLKPIGLHRPSPRPEPPRTPASPRPLSGGRQFQPQGAVTRLVLRSIAPTYGNGRHRAPATRRSRILLSKLLPRLTSVIVAKGHLASQPRARQPIAAMETPGRRVPPAKAQEWYAPVRQRRCLLLLTPVPLVQAHPAVGPVRTRGLRTATEPRSDGSRQNGRLAGMPVRSLSG